MSLVPMTIDEVLDQIVGKAFDLLKAATDEDGKLEDVEESAIIRGDRSRTSTQTPSVWLFPDIATIDTTTHGLAELWNFQLILAGIVKDYEPEDGFKAATNLAARAQQCLLGRKRRWELPFVEHVTPVRFDPSSPRNSSEKNSLFWADAVINVRFTRLEP